MDERHIWEGACFYALAWKSFLLGRPSNITVTQILGPNSRCPGRSQVSLLSSITQHTCCESYFRSYPFALQHTTNRRCILKHTNNGVRQTKSCLQAESGLWGFGLGGLIELHRGALRTTGPVFPTCPRESLRLWWNTRQGR